MFSTVLTSIENHEFELILQFSKQQIIELTFFKRNFKAFNMLFKVNFYFALSALLFSADKYSKRVQF